VAGNAQNIIIGSAQVNINGDDIGFTMGGTTLRYEPTFIDVEADQALGVVRKSRSSERMYINTTVLEVTLERMRQAFMIPAAQLTGGGSTLLLGYNSACWVEELAIVLIGPSPGCGTRTFTFGNCVTFGNREYAMQRDQEVRFEVEFEILKDSNGNFGTIIDS
jgi:hypothetical protein